jgi:hypothetical protein
MNIQGTKKFVFSVKDIGGGKLVAAMKAADSTIIDLIQLP